MSKRTALKIAPGSAPEGLSEGLDLTPELRTLWEETREKRELARQLVRMRSSAGLSQKELADRMGKDQAYVSRMESATHPMPKGQSIALYARSCGYVTAYAFLRPEDGPKDSAKDVAPASRANRQKHSSTTERSVSTSPAPASRWLCTTERP